MKKLLLAILIVALAGCQTLSFDTNRDGTLDRDEKVGRAVYFVIMSVMVGSISAVAYYDLAVLNPKKPPIH